MYSHFPECECVAIKNWNGNLHCDMSKNCFRKYLHAFKTKYELFFNAYKSHELKMFQISY